MADHAKTSPPELRQLLADLRWSIQSPSLITTSAITESRELCSDQHDLHAFSQQHEMGYRVGKYFERLVQRHIKQQPDWDLIHCGKQLNKGGRTIGELDFVFRDGEGNVRHVETAVKFYLYLPDGTYNGSQFVGPNSRDNFETKTARMFGHQLPLGQQFLPDCQPGEPHVKGIIFYPIGVEAPPELPQHMSSQHQKGTWFYESQFNDYLDSISTHSKSRFRMHRKPNWLAHQTAVAGELTPTEMVTAAKRMLQLQPDRPLMITHVSSDQSQLECTRLFCMPNDWPQHPNTD